MARGVPKNIRVIPSMDASLYVNERDESVGVLYCDDQGRYTYLWLDGQELEELGQEIARFLRQRPAAALWSPDATRHGKRRD